MRTDLGIAVAGLALQERRGHTVWLRVDGDLLAELAVAVFLGESECGRRSSQRFLVSANVQHVCAGTVSWLSSIVTPQMPRTGMV